MIPLICGNSIPAMNAAFRAGHNSRRMKSGGMNLASESRSRHPLMFKYEVWKANDIIRLIEIPWNSISTKIA